MAPVAMATALLTTGTPAVFEPAAPALSVTVSQTENLALAGQLITVVGRGFDVTKGIYVAVCVDNGPGVLPSPCIGGAGTTGGTVAGDVVASAWISSNPPSYAEGLTTPYGPGGSFAVTLFVLGRDPVGGIDCTTAKCAVVTRADHTRTDDRSQDTRTPLTFSSDDVTKPSPPPANGDAVAVTRSASPSSTQSRAGGTPVVSSRTTAPSTTGDDGPSRGWMWWLVVLVVVVLAPVALSRLRRTPPPSPPSSSVTS